MRQLLAITLAAVVLAGCNTAPHKDEDPRNIWGTKVDAPAGPDGLTMQDRVDLDLLRQELALDFTERLKERRALEIRETHPIQRPTVAVKYLGNPPEGLDLTVAERTGIYQNSYVKDDVIYYETDLAKMTLILERSKDGNPYDYREVTTTVPYGMCLDYITENLGGESKGYKIVSIECDQSELGMNY